MNDRVAVERHDHVVEVQLNRPDKHNALDWPMFQGLEAVARELMEASGVRAVVLHGNGPSFCSGLDFPSMMQDPEAFKLGFEFPHDQVANRVQQVAWAWRELPVPVVAALHGNTFGGGIQIALGADIRIAAPDARLSVMEIEYGLIPDMSGTVTLRELVGIDRAKDLIYSGRIVSGEEAMALGVVTRVADDPIAAAREWAAQVAGRSPDAIRAAKRLIHFNWTAETSVALHRECSEQLKLLGSANQVEAARAKLERRPATFEGD